MWMPRGAVCSASATNSATRTARTGCSLLGIMYFRVDSIRAWPERARKTQAVASAVHNVLEKVEVLGPDGPAQAWVIATNVYHRTAQGWRMVVHHASPGTESEIQEVSGTPQVLH